MNTQNQDSKNKTNILLVEHDELYAQMLVNVFQRDNIVVTHYASVSDLTHDKPDTDFDAVIIDNDMGQVNGGKLNNYLKQTGKTIPIVLITNDTPEDMDYWLHRIVGAIPKSSGPYAILYLVMQELIAKPAEMAIAA